MERKEEQEVIIVRNVADRQRLWFNSANICISGVTKVTLLRFFDILGKQFLFVLLRQYGTSSKEIKKPVVSLG